MCTLLKQFLKNLFCLETLKFASPLTKLLSAVLFISLSVQLTLFCMPSLANSHQIYTESVSSFAHRSTQQLKNFVKHNSLNLTL